MGLNKQLQFNVFSRNPNKRTNRAEEKAGGITMEAFCAILWKLGEVD